MNDKIPEAATETNTSQLKWRELPFDAATNFSLLGWLLDKFFKEKKSEEKIDLRLDE